jgi:hypothetical protein
MASPVYSTRILQAHGATSGATFTVPAGMVLVVRDVDCYANATGYINFFLIGAAGQAIWWFEWNPTDQKPAMWRGRQVLLAGETLTTSVSVGISDSLDYSISGYLLSNT